MRAMPMPMPTPTPFGCARSSLLFSRSPAVRPIRMVRLAVGRPCRFARRACARLAATTSLYIPVVGLSSPQISNRSMRATPFLVKKGATGVRNRMRASASSSSSFGSQGTINLFSASIVIGSIKISGEAGGISRTTRL